MMILRILALTLVLGANCGAAESVDARSAVDYIRTIDSDREWRALLQLQEVKQGPQWDKDQENPPMTMRKAAALAVEVLKREFHPDDMAHFQLITIELCRFPGTEHWYFVCEYEFLRGNQLEKMVHFRVPIIITFDGKGRGSIRTRKKI